MSAPVHPPGPHRIAAAALILAIAAAACGGGSPSAAPTATPTPRPTPTPFDVGKAFLAIVQDEDFSARLEIKGTMDMGATATVRGTFTGSGDDSRTLMKITVGKTTLQMESISTGGRSYTRTSPGPWLESEPVRGSKDENLGVWLRSLETVEDLGVVTMNGQKLHHLSAGEEVVPSGALGLDASTLTDPDLTIDFYAEDDGTPAVFAVEGTWTQLSAGQEIKVDFVMDMVISNVGSAITIDPPLNVWTSYTSPLGYTVAHPESFTVSNEESWDVYSQDGEEWIYVSVWPEATGLNADGFLAEILGLVEETWGAPVATTPTTLAGQPGYMATFNVPYDDGTPGIAYDVLAMHGNVGWDVTLYTVPASSSRDYVVFEQFLTTFKYEE